LLKQKLTVITQNFFEVALRKFYRDVQSKRI
jgi:ribosomal protein S21